ncbi:MAG: branched-chain amino acid ABC transporter permease [Sarcina sp.]
MNVLKKKKNIIFAMIAVLIVYLVIFSLQEAKIINNYYAGIIILAIINIILALSLNLITGITGQLCLGHAGFMAVGAYAGAIVSTKLNLPFVVALIAGGVLAALISVIIGIPTLRLSGDYFAITTLASGEIIRVLITNIDYLGGPRGITGIPNKTNFTWAFFLMVLIAIIILNLIKSAKGRAMISVRENEIASEAMGINTFNTKLLAFVIAAFFAGIAGSLYAHYVGFIEPNGFGFVRSTEILTFVVLGGMGSMSGSVIGAIILTFLPELLRGIKDLRMIIYSVALILLMIFRPKGIMGTKEISFTWIKKFFLKFKKKEEDKVC